MTILARYWSNINEKIVFYFTCSKQRKRYFMSCGFATTKIHSNQNSTRPSGQPTRFFIALRTELFDMPNFFALCCGPLGDQGPIFISHIPDLKHWKTEMSDFWQTKGNTSSNLKHFPGNHYAKDQSLSAEALQLSVFFFTRTEVLSRSRILHYSESYVLECPPWLYLYPC